MDTSIVPCRRAALCGLLLPLALPLALAQTVPNHPAPEEDPVQLDVFTVRAEIGSYIAVAGESATKTTTALRDVPMSVQVLNHEFIADLRAQRMSDVYQYITGLSYNDNRTSDGFSIRGFAGSTNVKNIQVDGLPGLGSRFNTPPSANIERVEVLKGPAAVLYGYMEPGGLVNMVTKRPQARQRTELFTSASAYASDVSSDTGWQATLDTTGPITRDKKLRYRLITQYEDLNSFRRDVFHKNFYLMPSLMYAWSPGTALTVGYEQLRERRASDDGLVAPLNREDLVAPIDTVYQNPDDREEDNGWTYTAEFKHTFGNGWKITATARRVDHNDKRDALRNQGIVNNTTNPALSTLTRRHNNQYNERNYETLDVNLQGDFATGPVKHHFLAGLTQGWEQNWFDRRSFYTTNLASLTVSIYDPIRTAAKPPFLPDSITDTQLDLFGAYGQLQTEITKKFKTVVSVRHDKQDTEFERFRVSPTKRTASSKATVPSFGLIYQPNEHLSLYASRSESFHPVANAFVNEDINGQSGHWDPEAATQNEAGVKFDWPAHNFSLTAAVFEIEKDNVIEQTATPNVNGVNYWVVVGSVKSQGAEVDLQWKPRPHIQLRGGYAYVDAFVSGSLTAANIGAPARNVPHHSANLWARYNVPAGALKGFGVGFGGAYQSERVGVTTNNEAMQFRMSSFVKLDAALYYGWSRYSFALNIKNLTDKRYFPGGGSGSLAGNIRLSAGEPRQVILSLRTGF
jgi:iron complex outermembrane receptor protein